MANPPGPTLIRPACAEDRAAVRAILHDTFESTWRPELTPAAIAAFLAEDRPGLYFDDHGREFHIAERDGEAAGFIHWRADFINALHVRSDHANRGVGTRLIDLAEGAIAAAGFGSARLETDTFNTRSRAFYAARGYVEAARYPDEEWSSGLTTILLVKPIA